MIKLVEKISDHHEADNPAIQVQCAFALNRRKREGDRARALAILEKVHVYVVLSYSHSVVPLFLSHRHILILSYCHTQVLEVKENHVPDYLCLCGRIYKDLFVESEHKDQEALKNAIIWWVWGPFVGLG